MKKNGSFKIKLVKGLSGVLLASTILTQAGCKAKTSNEIEIQTNEIEQVKNQQDNQFIILVNKDNPITESQIAEIDLVETVDVNGNPVYLQKDALEAFNKLKAALAEKNLKIEINTGFRSFEDQAAIYDELVAEYGSDYADAYAAPVGYSEHHTGLAIDVYMDRSQILGKTIYLAINPKFNRVKKAMYLIMADYGFILRYPEGKEEITGYPEEAWHIRYVGVETAKFIANKNITLEEFYEIMSEYESITESQDEIES